MRSIARERKRESERAGGEGGEVEGWMAPELSAAFPLRVLLGIASHWD